MRRVTGRAPAWARADVLLPLLVAYFAFAAYYVWQAWRRESPAIFTDELELTQISRAIAETGRPARREVAYHFTSLYPYFTAPAWWLRSTQDAFDAVKYLGALAMTAAIFPAYGIARVVLSQRWAVAAAVGAVAAPALSYSAILVEEPLAYLASTIALLLVLRMTLRPTRGRVAAALAGALAAAATRSQLAALLVVLLAALAVHAWSSGRMRSWRATWSTWDRVGAAVLALGVVIVLNAAASHGSQEWEITTRLYKDRLWTYGSWAAGALAIGLGVVPLVGGLASLVRPRGEPPTAERRAFTVVTAAALATFLWYAAIKGAYLSTTFSSNVVERNLIYLDPLLFVGLALLLARRGTRWWWAVGSGLAAVYVVVKAPYKLDQYPYYESHGLAMAAFANRIFHWPRGPIEATLVGIALAATVLAVLVARLPRSGRWAAGAIASVCALVLVWNLTAETYAANGEYRFSKFIVRSFPRPFDWIDRATGGGSTVMVGQQFGTNSNGYNLIEFWNSSIKKVWSVDPTSIAPPPGPTLTPDLVDAAGTLRPSPGTEYALAVNGVELRAPIVPLHPTMPGTTLYRLDGGPLRLAFTQTGVTDTAGWVTAPGPDAPAVASYSRFDAASAGPGFMTVVVTRSAWCGKDVPSPVTIRFGELVRGPDKQPRLGRVLETRRYVLHACKGKGFVFRNPGRPFRVEVSMERSFVPHELDRRSSDLRRLSGQVTFHFTRL